MEARTYALKAYTQALSGMRSAESKTPRIAENELEEAKRTLKITEGRLKIAEEKLEIAEETARAAEISFGI